MMFAPQALTAEADELPVEGGVLNAILSEADSAAADQQSASAEDQANAEPLQAVAQADEQLINELLGGMSEPDTLVDEVIAAVLAEEASAQEAEAEDAETASSADGQVAQEQPEDAALVAIAEPIFVLEPSSLDDLLSQQNLSVM